MAGLIPPTTATIDEFFAFAKSQGEHHPLEAAYAIRAGWRESDYEELYKAFIASTDSQLFDATNGNDFATKDKGDALEDIAVYFLKEGGFVIDMSDLTRHQIFQIDGVGLIDSTAVLDCIGKEERRRLGNQTYMEAKNQDKPFGSQEIGPHRTRMDHASCTASVAISSHGYALTGGKGIAETIRMDAYAGTHIHLLLSPADLLAPLHGIPPLILLRQALARTDNDTYRSDDNVEARYTKACCKRFLEDERSRLFPSP